jgi:iron(III) transport system permease protein
VTLVGTQGAVPLAELPAGAGGALRTGSARRAPWSLLLAGILVALVLISPLVFMLIEAAGAGPGNVLALIFRPLTAELFWNTIRLTVVVTLLCAILGTGAAWLVERTDLPFRRVWAVLLVVPLAIPDFVVSFGWASLSTRVTGFGGAVLVMTLSVYPLIYLPVASSLRNADPALEEVARSLGYSRVRTFLRVTLGQARVAILGGAILVVFVLLAEYGAFELLAYQTFTTEIFTEYSVSTNVPAASGLSLVLIVLGLLALAGESAVRGRTRVSRVDRLAQRRTTRHHLGPWRFPACLAAALLVALALGVPVFSAIYWWVQGTRVSLGGANVGLWSATWHTASYSAAAAALATIMALPVAVLAVRHDGRLRRLLERSTYLVLAMPGIIIALAFSYFSERYLAGFAYQTAPLLVLAYAILFFPLALVCVRASVAQAPAGLEEVARSLGRPPLAVWLRVTLPLVGPGLAAGFCLVFLSAVTELTATLILVPTGVQTLATQFWAYQTNLEYGQAAPFALVMILIAAVPSYVLGRFFDRLPSGTGTGAAR